MMRTSLLVLLAGMALGAGCSDDREAPSSVRISPTVSRVTGLYFDKDDRIGLTISRTSGDYVTNRLMTYDGSVFTASGLKWYESTQETSTLTAYYPYSEAGVPSAFSVEADQRQGCTPSDLLGAVAREVRPGSAPVAMVFYHLMSQLSVVVENNGSSPVAAVKIGGSVVEAVVDLAVPSAKAKAGAAAVQIEAFEAEPDSRYRAVLVPQQTTLDVEVELQDGSVCRKSVSDALLEGGRCYDLSVVISGGGTPQIEVSIRAMWSIGWTAESSSGPMAETTVRTEWITRGNTTGRWRSTERSGWRRTCGTSRREPSSEQEFGNLRAVLR